MRSALDPDAADGIHAVAEAWKLAMADREAWFGDRSPVTVADLLAPDYVAGAGRSRRGVREPSGCDPARRVATSRVLAAHVRRLMAGEAP